MKVRSPHVILSNLKVYIDGVVFVCCTMGTCNLNFIAIGYVI